MATSHTQIVPAQDRWDARLLHDCDTTPRRVCITILPDRNNVVEPRFAGPHGSLPRLFAAPTPGTLVCMPLDHEFFLLLSVCLSDRTGERFFHICAPWWGVMVGYIIGVTTMSIAGRYVAMFLMASGYAGASFPLLARNAGCF